MPATSTPVASWMALAIGALEPGDAAALLRSAGPGAALRLATMRTLAGLPAAEEPAHAAQEPAPLPRLAASLGAAPLLGSPAELPQTAELVRVGSRVRVYVVAPGPASQVRPILMRRSERGSVRLLPIEGAPWPTLDRFQREDDVHVIDLVVGEPIGLQTLVLGLLDADVVEDPWPAGDARDARVMEAVLNGGIPGAVLSLQVIGEGASPRG